MRPARTIDACRTSHQLLLSRLMPLEDDDFRASSSLPGYTRGHVVTHMANKTKAHTSLFEGAAVDEVRRLHPDEYDPDAAAAGGATGSAVQLRSNLAHSFEQLEYAWDELEDERWERLGIMTAGPRTMAEIVGHHLRNVEVHHVDLDIGYRPSDWPPDFVEAELPKRLGGLPHRADHAQLLAWLLGRAAVPELGPW